MGLESLPAGWRMVRFGEVVRNVDVSVRDPQESGLERYVGLEHIDPESLHIKGWGLIAEGTSFTRQFRAGQVLFGKRRAYQRKVAVPDFDGLCSSDILVFEPSGEDLMAELLPFLVQTDGFFEHALGTSAGSLSPRTKWRDLAAYEFPLPPKDEQRRIAEVLWAAEECVERTWSVSQAVVTARQAHIADFVSRFLSEHKMEPLDTVIDPLRPITYGILKPGLHIVDGIPVVKVRDYPDGQINGTDILHTSKEIAHEYRRSRLKSGDLLLSIRGTIGRVAEVPDWLDGANITQDTARLSIIPQYDTRYIRAMLESDQLQKQMQVATTGLAVKGINIGEVRKLRMPLPSRKIQEMMALTLEAFALAESKAVARLGETRRLSKMLACQMLAGMIQKHELSNENSG